MPDAAKKTPAGQYSIEERIGVLEELLDERYSCRAYRPEPVPRLTIDRSALAERPHSAAAIVGDRCAGTSGEVGKNVNPVAVLRPDAVAIFVVPYVVTMR